MTAKDVVRHMMDQGATRDAMAEALKLSPRTIENYQYEVRRPGEIVKRNGRPYRRGREDSVRFSAHMVFTPEQLQRIRDNAARFGCARPAMLMELILATIADDNLFDAVLGDRDAD